MSHITDIASLPTPISIPEKNHTPVCVHGILGFPHLAVVPRGLKLDLDVAFGTLYIYHRAIPNLRASSSLYTLNSPPDANLCKG